LTKIPIEIYKKYFLSFKISPLLAQQNKKNTMNAPSIFNITENPCHILRNSPSLIRVGLAIT
jgi:hypothetical protein